MKKIMFAIALTLALTTGIASPISAAAQTTAKNTIMPVAKDGGGPAPQDCGGLPCVI
jgi:hypothetical protein